MRLFLDANILFTAAHNPKGKAALVIELGQAGLWQLDESDRSPDAIQGLTNEREA